MKNESLLVSRAALWGDQKAFGQLTVMYQSSVQRFFLNLTSGDEELSKDLAQETFIKAWLSIASFRAMAKFSTWLYRIAYNTFCDYCRAKKPVTVDVNEISNSMADRITDKDFNIDFARALKTLNEEERAVMLLFYMEDQTITTVSKILDCPAGTVKSHLSRGRQKLSDYFKRSGYDR